MTMAHPSMPLLGMGAMPAGGFSLRKTPAKKTETTSEEKSAPVASLKPAKPYPMQQTQSMMNLNQSKDPLAALRAKKAAAAAAGEGEGGEEEVVEEVKVDPLAGLKARKAAAAASKEEKTEEVEEGFFSP